MSTALDKLRESNKRARDKTTKIEQGIVRKATIVGTGMAIGWAEKKGVRQSIGPVSIKLGTGLALTVGELFTKGALQRFFGAVSDTNLAIYSRDAIVEGTFVAGGEV